MRDTRLSFLLVVLILSCGACACSPEAPPSAAELPLTQCTDPRPQACTREYNPVCASRDTGVRCVTTPCPSAEWKTYGNACDACADPAVIGHRPGTCE